MNLRTSTTMCLVLAVVICVAYSVSASTPTKFKIGAIPTLTGEAAYIGEYTIEAADMAVDEINEAGGINGVPLEVIYEDDGGTTPGAINALNKLIYEDKVHGVIGSVYSVKTLPMVPVLQREGGPPVTTGATTPQLNDVENDWIFRVRADDGIVASLAVIYAVENLGYDRIGIVYINDDFGIDGLEVMQQTLRKKYGMEPVAVESITEGDKDFTAQLRNFRRADAQIIITWVHPLEGGLFVRQKRQLGLKCDILGCSHFVSQQTMDIMGSAAAEGLYAVTDFAATNPDPDIQDWVKRYHARYGKEPTLFSVWVYDSVYLFAEAIRTGGWERNQIRDSLAQIKDYKGMTAKFSFDAQLNGVHETLIAQVRDGEPVILERVSTN